MTNKHKEPELTTQDTGNGNPPPKNPPQPTQPPSTDSVDDTGNGNPPPKG